MDPVLLSVVDGIAWLTLNRPEAGNAIDLPLAEVLARYLEELAIDPAVRCVVLTGQGRMFCVGGDVHAFARAGAQASDHVRRLASVVHEAVLLLSRMPQPVVAVVNGPAAGAGLSLTLAADIVVSARSAFFLAAYTQIGLTPDGGLSWRLPKCIGMRRAQAMILTNRRVSSEEALRIGLVTDVVDDEQVSDAGRVVAAELAAIIPGALDGARRLLLDGCAADLEAHLCHEADLIVASASDVRTQAAIASFSARAPRT